MPQIQIGASMPDTKQDYLKTQFKYGAWAFKLKNFDTTERTLKYCLMQMHSHVRFCYYSALCIRYMWYQMRHAFKQHTQTKYDKAFEELFKWSMEEYQTYQRRRALSAPYQTSAQPDMKLIDSVFNSYKHLNYLADRSGFGNKMLKTYDFDESVSGNLLG